MELNQEKALESAQKVTPLIDILYKDTYRIDSFIAQLLNGTLRSVKKQENTSQGSSYSYGGSIKIAKAQNSHNEFTNRLLEQNIDPHDHNVIELMNALDLPVYDKLPENALGTIVHLRGNISIRDFSTYAEIVPFMAKNYKLFDIKKQEATDVNKMFSAITKVIPMNIEIEMIMPSNEVIRGILKRESLLDNYQDLMAIHGPTLPGDWHVIGILDFDTKTSHHNAGELRSGIDGLAQVAKTLYNDDSVDGSIIPILIFRYLNK